MERRLENLLGATVLAASDRVVPALEARAGQRGSAAAALVHLAAYPGESVEQLGRVLGISQPGAVAVVERLVTAGLLERRPGPDRRTRALHLTAEGGRASADVLATRADALAGLLAPLGPGERDQLEALLATVVGHLADDRPGARTICRLCDRAACTAAGCPLDHTVMAAT